MSLHIKYPQKICGGELVFSHKEQVEEDGKLRTKHMYKCKKCGDLVSLIIMGDLR